MNAQTSAWTQACEDRDFPEWHRGCAWCAVWLVWLDHPVLTARVAQSRAALQPWLLPRYARQPHISLAYRGLVSGTESHSATEFTAEQLHADIAQLQDLQMQPWQVTVQGVSSFTTVPYLAVRDAGRLHQVHKKLSPVDPYPDWRYVPHVTLGHYAQSVPMDDMVANLAQVDGVEEAVTLTVNQLSLARYRTNDIAGPLTLDGCWDLRLQRYVPQAGALLRPEAGD